MDEERTVVGGAERVEKLGDRIENGGTSVLPWPCPLLPASPLTLFTSHVLRATENHYYLELGSRNQTPFGNTTQYHDHYDEMMARQYPAS